MHSPSPKFISLRRSQCVWSSACWLLLLVLLALVACNGSRRGGSAVSVPQADFGGTPTEGARPLDVQFANFSQGDATAWQWDFGDGATSTERAPVHRYVRPGVFTVGLSASSAAGRTTKTSPAFVRVTAPVTDASFEAQTAGTPPIAPWEAFFGTQSSSGHLVRAASGGGDAGMPTDGSLWADLGAESTDNVAPPREGRGSTPRTGAGLAHEFTFPDGASVLQVDVAFLNAEELAAPGGSDWLSVDVSDGVSSRNLLRRGVSSPIATQSALHGGLPATAVEAVTADLASLFPGASVLTPFTLTAQVGNGGNNLRPSRLYLDRLRFSPPQPALNPSFVATPIQIAEGQEVTFRDQTAGAQSWAWDFGDGRGSNAQNPVHTYSRAGMYDVTLRVAAPGTQGEVTAVDHVQVRAADGSVNFAGRPLKVVVGAPVTFTNLSDGTFVDNWLWEFGDRQTSNQAGFDPPLTHNYTALGSKTVTLSGRLTNGQLRTLPRVDYIDVQQAVAITTQPRSTTVNEGQPVTFTVTGTGTAPLHYEWRRNDVVIPGAPDLPRLDLPPTTPQDDGARFRVRISNDVSEVVSDEATLTVVVIPRITTQPQPTAVATGGRATFSVAHTGTSPFTYTWRRNGVAIPGALSQPTYTTAPVTIANNGERFSVRVANAAGAATSTEALLTVTTLPVINVQPQPQAACLGGTATFAVSAAGTPPLTYTWRRNGVPIAGAPSQPTYVTPPVTLADNGALFSVQVANTVGSVTSNDAALSVVTTPSVSNPTNQSVCAGSPATFQVTVSGGGLTLQWFRNAVAIAGANAATYTIATTVVGDSGASFFCRASNACSQVSSAAASLTVRSAPAITTQPASPVYVVEGAPASFAVVASGTAPLRYQWRRNGTNITGATSSSYATPATMLSDDGARYSCVVSNDCGSVTSNDGVLEVAKRWSTIWSMHITGTCTGCHGTAGGLNLSGNAASAYGNTVNVPTSSGNTCAGSQRIQPRSPSTSSLYRVLGSTFSCISQNHTTFTNNAQRRQDIFDCIMAGIPNN